MDSSFYYAVPGVILIFHLPLAIVASREIIDYPLWQKSTKLAWLILVWLLPYLGYKAITLKLDLKLKGGGTGGEDTYTSGGD